MKKYSVKFLLIIILCFSFIFTTALCQNQELLLENLEDLEELEELESIPISSPIIGPELVKIAQTQKSLNDKEIRRLLLSVNKRDINENDPSCALLKMKMNLIHRSAGIVLKRGRIFKGSGTVLYRSNDHLLVLTAYHNLYNDFGFRTYNATQMTLLEDNRDRKHAGVILAKMVNDSYIQVGQKDIVLVAMKLEKGNKFFENKKIIFDVLDFNSTQQPGQDNSVQAQISQYPTYFDWYIKIDGIAYHDNGIGYHFIPTLPGASGSAVIIDGKIAGVHVSSGIKAPSGTKNIKYRGRNLLVENNIFELISIDEIEQVNADLNNSGTKDILADLIQKYVNGVNKQKREKLIEYLKYGRKAKKDKDTNREVLKEINKLNSELRFWTSYWFWPEEIKEITDEVVEAYNNNAKIEEL